MADSVLTYGRQCSPHSSLHESSISDPYFKKASVSSSKLFSQGWNFAILSPYLMEGHTHRYNAERHKSYRSQNIVSHKLY